VVEHVLFAVSCMGWENKLAVRAMRMLPQFFEEFHRGRNLVIFPALRVVLVQRENESGVSAEG